MRGAEGGVGSSFRPWPYFALGVWPTGFECLLLTTGGSLRIAPETRVGGHGTDLGGGLGAP